LFKAKEKEWGKRPMEKVPAMMEVSKTTSSTVKEWKFWSRRGNILNKVNHPMSKRTDMWEILILATSKEKESN
jgi:hypothetical protein